MEDNLIPRTKSPWWVQTKKADFYRISEEYGISPILARLMRNRDLVEEREIEQYLHGSLKDLPDARQMKDLPETVALLLDAVKNHIKIRIIGDYDADGINSICILVKSLEEVGADCSWDIPDRIRDGYGLSIRFVEEAKRDGIGLLLTCDNGISAIEPIALAKSYGMTVCVTDHHQLLTDEEGNEILPPADTSVNPHRKDSSYPFRELCGAGVVWKLSGVLLEEAGISKERREELLAELLEFAAIATVADVMDLRGENRILVKEGLKRIRRTSQTGLRALIAVQNLEMSRISAYHIGFVIGPTLNAAGRLETAGQSVSLLLSDDPDASLRQAEILKNLNEERKSMTLEGLERAHLSIASERLDRDKVLIVYLPGCHESLAGIIAGKVREYYGRPAIVLTDAEDGGLKGSARSVEAFDMFRELCKCKDLLSRFGGHPMAAGLSLPKENLKAFRKAMNENCTKSLDELIPKEWIDLVLPFEHATEVLCRELDVMEPFGKGNEKPVFAARNLQIAQVRTMGAEGQHLKLSLVDDDGSRMDALLFHQTDSFFRELEEEYGESAVKLVRAGKTTSVRMHILYYPSINEFRGRISMQAMVNDYRFASKT